MRAYECIRGVGILLVIVGGFSVVSFFSSQMRIGSGEGTTLVGGCLALGVGILLLILSDLGLRLVRVERKVSSSGKSDD